MKKLLLLPLVALPALGLAATAPDQGRDGLRFRADLGGDNEVPPVDTDTEGRIRIDFEPDFSSATLRLDLRNGRRITQAHFHCAEEGVNGPVVIFIAGFHDRGWDVHGRFLDNVTITDQNIVNPACGATLRDIADAMRAGRIYANVHSVANPSGVVRGQMRED
jgi:hypothetical protein